MKIKRQIVYRPELSVRENAALNKCSEATIRKYIKDNHIDRRTDNKEVLIRSISSIKDTANVAAIMRETGLSRQTVKKYLLQQKTEEVQAGKVSAFEKQYIRNLIGSVSDDQSYIINSILTLYNNCQPIDADLTYSQGEFYRHVAHPKFKYDKYPLEKVEGVLPLSQTDTLSNIYSSVIYDLPYNIQTGSSTSIGKIKTRFTHFSSLTELFSINQEMLQRAHRLLVNRGILIIKTQDTCYANQQVWVRQFIENQAAQLGFAKLDEFLLVKQGVMGNRGTEQHHARRQHSFFLVFRKQRCKTIKSVVD